MHEAVARPSAEVDGCSGSQLRWPGDGLANAKELQPRDADGVTASEFSFLALGLVLGLVTGAALVEFIRARPPAPREVKLTVAHDAIPRRATTLADDAFVAVGPEPARGGPADRRLIGGAMPAGGSERRTTVRFSETAGQPVGHPGTTAGGPSMAGAIPIARPPDPPGPGRDHGAGLPAHRA